MKRPSTGLAALAAGALLASAAAGAAAARDLNVAECTAAWKKSSASRSCGALVRDSAGTSLLRAARISVVARTVAAPHPLFFWSSLDVEARFCSILVQCLRSGQSAAAASANCPTGFLGGSEDVKKAVNDNGTLKRN